jgi:guanylate kinase
MADIQKGLLIVLSGPSGVGKGTVCKAIRQTTPDIIYSVSATTRTPREGEQEGINYFFKTKEEFRGMIEHNQLLEWAQYADNYYGTPRAFVEDTLNKGLDVILEIEVQGALQVKEKFPEGVFIFLAPPTLGELEQRIIGRGTESQESIRKRMNIAHDELRLMEKYDYVVVNDQVSDACSRIQSILVAERCRKERIIERYANLLGRN